MTVWRYKAKPAAAGSTRPACGVITAPTGVAARQLLRQAGLRPVRLRAVQTGPRATESRFARFSDGYLRRRRSAGKAEFLDAVATLLRSGVPPRESLLVLAGSRSKSSAPGLLARALADEVAQGVRLSAAAAARPGWFDPAECAVIAAGERSGELETALSRLAERQARKHDLGARLTSVLIYPFIVAAAGIGVGCFLSVRVLPQLAGVLSDAGLEAPALTRAVISTGSALVSHAFWALPLALLTGVLVMAAASTQVWRLPSRAVRRAPTVFRRVRTAESFLALADLTEAGLTFVESIRIIAPTSAGPFGTALARAWEEVARRVEQGARLEDAMDDVWFSEEHRRLIAAGAQSGELATMLRRIGERDRRSAHRLIDRAAALIEPAAIIALTAFVGLIVLSAILPIVRLQEIIG